MFFTLLLAIVAFLYAAVGHGGASGYLALSAIFGIPPADMKISALLLNLIVSAIAFVQFFREKHFIWRIFWPLAAASIPAAFLGGTTSVDPLLYKRTLGALLLLPVFRLWFDHKNESAELVKSRPDVSFGLGAAIGFLSGMIGIGGGILLSPILLALRWTTPKQTAAISALFIFVNSAAGLAGISMQGLTLPADFPLHALAVTLGGLAGAWFGAARLPQQGIRRILALVLLIAAFKLLTT